VYQFETRLVRHLSAISGVGFSPVRWVRFLEVDVSLSKYCVRVRATVSVRPS